MRPRRRITWAVAAVLCMAGSAWSAAPAAAAALPKLIDQHGHVIHGQRVRWLEQSRMPLVLGRIRVISAGCPGHAGFSGCVFTERPRTLYLRPATQNPKAVLYHELGHTFDLTLFRHRDRAAFKRILHLRGGWFTGSGPPSELFAEGYALCARFGLNRPPASKLGWTRSLYGYRPTRAQHRAVCKLVLAAGAPKRQRAHPKPQPPPNAPPVAEQKPPAPPQQGGATQPGLVPGLSLPGSLTGTGTLGM